MAFQQKFDGASAQALAQEPDVVDGEVIELPGGVEGALEDEGVEMREELKQVAEGLIGDGDGLRCRGGIKLGDQGENKPRELGE